MPVTRSELARRRARRTYSARAARRRRNASAGLSGGGRSANRTAGRGMAVRLIVCGVLFVLLVAVKLLFPEAVNAFARSAVSLIGRDADFQAAFAAVGRAVSGQADVADSLQDAYAAVFNPESRTERTPDRTAAGDPLLEPGLRLASYTAPELPAPDLSAVRETVLDSGGIPAAAEEADRPAQTASAAVSTLAYTYAAQALPANASMEQRNLGFTHCTPVLGSLNSGFGWRDHPVMGENKFHYGVDLGAAEGTDVLAFADGVVYATGESSTLGNYIMLEHAGGYITLYAHCSKITATSGSVSMGDKIAEVGATGLVTGPHLHFELHDGELYLNPIYYVELG